MKFFEIILFGCISGNWEKIHSELKYLGGGQAVNFVRVKRSKKFEDPWPRKDKMRKKKKRISSRLGTLTTAWILRKLNPSYNSILCMLKERTSLVTIQKICVEFFHPDWSRVHANKVPSFVDVVPIFGLQMFWWFMFVALCQSLSLILGLQRSQCRWVGGWVLVHPALGVGDILVPSN